VKPTEQVFLGVDGVVPMAKLRQQRLRRFKSHWTASEEERIGKRDGSVPRWDTNAITPGTAFMERLGVALKGLRGQNVQWVVSTADEPGEGEHKAMSALRSCSARDSHVIYGLDADLIVLSLLQPVKELWLFREAVECGEVQYTDGEEEYRYFSIHTLRKHLCGGQDDAYLLDYCMAMSLLGNDFLPHSFTFKLKDGGHDTLLDMLRDVRRQYGQLITERGWSKEGLLACLQWLTEREDQSMLEHCSAKLARRWQPARGSNPTETAIDEWNKTPMRTFDEIALMASVAKGATSLRADWRAVYTDRYLGLSTACDMTAMCRNYFVGLDWIVDYYLGKPVDREWCFHAYTTPLWADLAKACESLSVLPKQAGPNTFQLKPQEQLALVLPTASFWLIRDRKLRSLPRQLPQLWPSTFQLFMAGRGQMWECEALLPLFSMDRLRKVLNTTT
jgi:5'-3' exonuclease